MLSGKSGKTHFQYVEVLDHIADYYKHGKWEKNVRVVVENSRRDRNSNHSNLSYPHVWKRRSFVT